MAPLPEVSFMQRYDAVQESAVECMRRGDFGKAERELLALAVEGDPAGEAPGLALGLFEQVAWIRWSEGDLAGALSAIDAERDASTQIGLGGHMSVGIHLHQLWRRALILRELAERVAQDDRKRALGAARQARREYEPEAMTLGKHDEVQILRAYFAALDRDANAARAALNSPYLPEERDPLDNYLLALACDTIGARARAQSLRDELRNSPDGVMKLVVSRRLQSDTSRGLTNTSTPAASRLEQPPAQHREHSR